MEQLRVLLDIINKNLEFTLWYNIDLKEKKIKIYIWGINNNVLFFLMELQKVIAEYISRNLMIKFFMQENAIIITF